MKSDLIEFRHWTSEEKTDRFLGTKLLIPESAFKFNILN